MLSAHKTTFKTSTTINTTLEMQLTNKYSFITLASRKDQEGYFIMIENYHDSVIYTMLKSWLSCLYFTYAAHWSNRSRLDVHWNRCVYFFWLILVLFLLNIDWNTFFLTSKFYDVQICVVSHDRRYLFYFKKVTSFSWTLTKNVIQHINSHDKFSTFCIFPIYTSTWCIYLFKSD